MRKRILCVLASALCVACTESGLRASQVTLGGAPQRIAGTGDLSQPRFAGGSGNFLAVTDGGQPRMVFVVNAVTLEVEPVSFRPPPPGVPATPTALGEFVRDLLVVPDDDSSDGSVTGTGELTIKGNTRPVALEGTIAAAPATDPFGRERLGLALTATIDRTQFGVSWNMPNQSGGDYLANDVKLVAELALVRSEA